MYAPLLPSRRPRAIFTTAIGCMPPACRPLSGGVRQNHEILDAMMLPAPEVLALTLPRSISVPPQGFRRTPK